MSGWLHERDKLVRLSLEEKPAPAVAPTALPLDDIKICEAVFQHRSGLPAHSAAHVDTLTKALDRGQLRIPLAPLTVFWIGKHWYCIDGHHRIKAYRKALYCLPVPVIVFKGTLDQAMAEALRGNSRDKLQMPQKEKTDAAWRMVVGSELSKKEIAEAAGISESTVANMRRVQAKLRDEKLDTFSWSMARVLASGQGMEQGEREEWVEREAQELANSLVKTYGKKLGNNIEVTARALETYSTHLASGLAEYWASMSDEDDGEDDD